MSTLPVPIVATDTGGAELTPAERELITDALRSAKSDSTRRNYQNDWARFAAWCQQKGRTALPADPTTLALYITEHADTLVEDGPRKGTRAYALSTLRRWKASINYVHRATGFPRPGDDDGVREVYNGLARMYANTKPRPPRKRDALLLDPLRDIVAHARADAHSWRTRVRERRDTVILLVGWTAALRRSEVVAITPRNILPQDVVDPQPGTLYGYTLDITRSKTDPYGKGMVKVLPPGTELASCAPCALIRWLEVLASWQNGGRTALMRDFTGPENAEHTEHVCSRDRFGDLLDIVPLDVPLIRPISRAGLIGDTAPDSVLVHRVVRERALAAGWSQVAVDGLGGHSLRAGFVTEGFRRGKPSHAIKRQTGHRSEAVLEGYARHSDAWVANAATDIGL